MLGQRIVTAVVLLAVLLPALLAPRAWPFAVVTLVFIAAAGWEWSRLNGLAPAAASASGAALAVLGALWLLGRADGTVPASVWTLALLLWVLGGAWVLRRGVAGWPGLPRPLRWGIGMAVLALAWAALASARERGVGFVLSVFVLVWVADIAAYFGGRALGRRKLAPAISPGKSWEGVFSGMLGVLTATVAWLWGIEPRLGGEQPSLFGHLWARFGTVGLTVAVLFLTGMSVVGDLVESLVKRAAGAKDSSQLLPGHGGVLDRIDALLPVLPLALALCTL
jgi:phosphatidate cytidylyltransferase